MTDSYANQVTLNIIDGKVADARCIVPGKVKSVDRAADRERDVTLLPGIGRRQAGEQIADGPVPSAPLLSIGGGGWGLSMPIAEGDECLGLAADRNSQRWRQNREPGEAHSFADRTHDLSDVFVLPFIITPPVGAPDVAGDDVVIHGPDGDALRFANLDNAVTITKGGAPVATVSMAGDGEVLIEVEAGKSVKIGGPAALSLTKWAALDAAVTAMLLAGSGAGTGAPGTTGKLAFDAAKLAYDSATASASPETLKAKGE